MEHVCVTTCHLPLATSYRYQPGLEVGRPAPRLVQSPKRTFVKLWLLAFRLRHAVRPPRRDSDPLACRAWVGYSHVGGTQTKREVAHQGLLLGALSVRCRHVGRSPRRQRRRQEVWEALRAAFRGPAVPTAVRGCLRFREPAVRVLPLQLQLAPFLLAPRPLPLPRRRRPYHWPPGAGGNFS
jgi:hypothetical protein